MKNICFVFILFAFPFLSFAQNDFRPGYVVNLQGDTLSGEVNFKGDIKSARECVFRANSGTESIVFQPDQLAGYGFKGNKIYEAKVIQILTRNYTGEKFEEIPVNNQEPVNFMQVLVKGNASLYFFKDINSEGHFYILKDGSLKELIYLQANIKDPKTTKTHAHTWKLYIQLLNMEFRDCPKIFPDIASTDLKSSQLTSLFLKYNNCVAPEQPVFTENKRKSKVTKGLLAGISLSELTITIENHYLGAGDFNSKIAPTAGIFIDFTLPALNEKLSLNNALYFTSRNYKADYFYTPSDLYKGNYKIAYDFKLVRLETLLRYTAPQKKTTPFLQAGISNSLMLTSNEDISWVKYYLDYPGENKVEKDYLTPIFRKYQLGFVVGSGVKYNLKDGPELLFQTNYEFNTGFTKAIGISSNSHNLIFVIGVGF